MKLKFLQEGGAVPAPEEQQQDPLMQLVDMAAQALEAQDPDMAMQVCQGLVELAQQAQQQAGPAPGPDQMPPEGEPVYRAGGQLIRRIKR